MPAFATAVISTAAVLWGEKALNKVFTEFTDDVILAFGDLFRGGEFFVDPKGVGSNHYKRGSAVQMNQYKLKSDAQGHLKKLSTPTTHSHTFIKYLLRSLRTGA